MNENLIQCRVNHGTPLADEWWEPGQPVSFLYMPGGIHTLRGAGFRDGSIEITVAVDPTTPGILQQSFDRLIAAHQHGLYADEEHEARKAVLRCPPETEFCWGTHLGCEGVLIKNAMPTTYGAECINGRVYFSWSPEFQTDARYDQTVRDERGIYRFLEGVRGSRSNPALICGLSNPIGSCTNSPAFGSAIGRIKARMIDTQTERVLAAVREQCQQQDDEIAQILADAFRSPEQPSEGTADSEPTVDEILEGLRGQL